MRASLLVTAALVACGGVDMPSGLDAWMVVRGARYVPGAMPAASGAVAVTAVDSPNNTVRPGQRGKVIAGRCGAGTYSVALGLDGDAGWWILPVAGRSVLLPGELEFEGELDLGSSLPPGSRRLRLHAIDGAGRLGPASGVDLRVATTIPDGVLVVALRWDSDADLNLVVRQPDGNALSNRGLRTPSGTVVRVDPAAGPSLDLDANARCAIDGRRAENAVWSAVPAGTWSVRVEAWSLCGRAAARFEVVAYARGAVIARATGVFSDARAPVPGEALEVLRFETPP